MQDATEIMDENQSKALYENLPPTKFTAPKMPFNNSLLKGDLDNVILMALRKEPSRRYPSVEDLSKDISNYLNGLPVSARPNTFWYRTSKFFSRNKTASIVGILLILSLILGIITTAWQAVIARRERDLAQQRFNDVRRLSNSLLFEITPKIERLQGSTEAREILVKRALEYLDSLAAVSQNDVSLQAELASAYEKVGELQSNASKPSLNDVSGAAESYLKSQKIRQNLPDSLENQKGLAENFRQYSDVIFAQNNVTETLETLNKSLEIYQKLVSQNPESLEIKIEYIKTKIEYGATYSSNNQFSEAIPVFQKAISELESLDKDNREVKTQTALAIAQLSNAFSWNEEQSKAEMEMTKAIKIIEDLLIEYPNDTLLKRLAFRIYTLSSGIYEEVNNNVSLEFAQKALQMATKAVENDSADVLAKASLASAYSRAGNMQVKVNQNSSAISNLENAEKLLSELINQDTKNLTYQRTLGVLYLRKGESLAIQNNYSEALKSYQKSVEVLKKLAEMDDKNTLARRDQAQSLKNVGFMQIKLNQNKEAKETFQNTLDILNQLKSINALGNLDQKMIDDIKSELQKLGD